MAFTDPQSITVNAVATSLPRVLTGTTVGQFVSGDALVELTIDPRGTAKRRRNVARLYVKKSVTDPLTGLASIQGFMVSFTIDRPNGSITDSDIVDAASGLITWLTASTNAKLKQLAAGEN